MNEKENWRQFLLLREKEIRLATPNLIGVGAARSGTTSLYHFLKESPEIYMSPVKELAYFSNHVGKWAEREYLLFFYGGESHRYRGEISPHYLHSPKTPDRIKQLNPEAKVIIQLRNPLRRTVSHYRHHYHHHKMSNVNAYFRKGLEGLRKDVKGIPFSHPTSNMRQSFYYVAVCRYLEVFGENALVLFHDDFKNDPKTVMQKLSEWLRVKLPDRIRKVNISKTVEGSGSLLPALRSEIIDTFAEDFAKTCDLFGRDTTEFIV